MVQDLHSIIVPVYFSCSTLNELVTRVKSSMDKAGLDFELILVDDGSTDGSFEKIMELSHQNNFIKGFRLSRNFGHQAALTIGLQQAQGEFVAIIDDDLQDPPEILPRFFSKLKENLDVVYGIRKKRQEGILKRTAFHFFYVVLSYLSHTALPVDAGDFCVMRYRVVEAMLRMPEANPFLRGIRSWVGFRQEGIEYERDHRKHGSSGYSFRKYIRLSVTGILMFSYAPLRMAMITGLVVSILVALYSIGTIIYWLFNPFEVPGYLTMLVLISFLGGVQLSFLGIIGEYIARLIDNNRRWPIAFIMERTEDSTHENTNFRR